METNFTKGEWEVSFSHINKKCAYSIKGFTGNANEDIANAQLISAAPYLLDSLNELLELLEEHKPNYYLLGHYRKAKRAIEKAVGS